MLTGCKVRDTVRYDRFTSCSVALDCSLHRLQEGLKCSSKLSRCDLLQRCFVLHRAAARTRMKQEVNKELYVTHQQRGGLRMCTFSDSPQYFIAIITATELLPQTRSVVKTNQQQSCSDDKASHDRSSQLPRWNPSSLRAVKDAMPSATSAAAAEPYIQMETRFVLLILWGPDDTRR